MKFRQIGYDFEVKKDWGCCTFAEKKDPSLPLTDKSQLNFITFQSGQELDFIDFIIKNKQNSIFVGYNNVYFDNYCAKCVWYNINPYKVVYHCIEQGEKPGQIEELKFKKNLDFKTFDLMRTIGRSAPSLKDIEGNLGIEIITDKSLEEDTGQNLTKEQKEEEIKYNRHDVYATLVLLDKMQAELDAYILLIEKFNLPGKTLEKTKASFIEVICKDKIHKQLNPLSFRYKTPSFINLYDTTVKDAMESFDFEKDNKGTFDYQGDGNVYKIGRGGAHYAIKNYIQEFDGETILVMNDFQAFYPEMLANVNNQELRYINPVLNGAELRALIDLRLSAKANGDKELANALKIVINGVYGKLIDQYSPLFFGPSGLSVCLTGQLITLMVCQELKKQGLGKLVQVNTDGFYYKLNKSELDKFNQIMDDFQKKIGITFERTIINKGKIVQKDVNNYIIYDAENDKTKVKGDVVKRFNTKQTFTSYSMPIVDIAIVNYLLKKISVNETILKAYNENKQNMFQIIYNMKGKNWEGCYYGNKKIQKINRGFASGDSNLPSITQLKNGTYCKFPDRPDHVYIYNGDLSNLDVRKINLDVQYYINLANKGIQQYLGGNNGR